MLEVQIKDKIKEQDYNTVFYYNQRNQISYN